MSTTAQRAFERLAKSVTIAFKDFCIRPSPFDLAEPLEVKCEIVATKSAGMVGTGLRWTIGDRELTVDEAGAIVSLLDCGKPVDISKMLRDPRQQSNVAHKETVTLKTNKVGDFSNVDWTGNG